MKWFLIVAFIVIGCFALLKNRQQEEVSSNFGDSMTGNDTQSAGPAKHTSTAIAINEIKSDAPAVVSTTITMALSGSAAPKELTETFPGLDAIEWEYGAEKVQVIDGKKVARTKDWLKKFKADPYDGRNTRLIEIKEGDLVTLRNEKFILYFNSIADKNNKTQFVFQKRRYFETIPSAGFDAAIPACMINLVKDHQIAERERDSSWVFFVKRVEHPVRSFEGYEGVRIIIDQSKIRGEMPWLDSVECFLKAEDSKFRNYTNLQLIHLMATFGVRGYLSSR